MSGESSDEEGALKIDVGGSEEGEKVGRRGKKAVVWRPGDVVWAKVQGFNFWPAKVNRKGSVSESHYICMTL